MYNMIVEIIILITQKGLMKINFFQLSTSQTCFSTLIVRFSLFTREFNIEKLVLLKL